MASHTTDGTFTSPVEHGTKQVSLPLQSSGNRYATQVRRNYIQVPASSYAPIIGQTTSYTNLLTYGDDFSNAAWTKTRSSATAASTDPEGGATASKLVEDSSNNTHLAEQTLTVASGAITFGVLAKAAERSWIFTTISNATDGTLTSAYFDLSTGVTGTVGGGTATIRNAGNGWYWCYITATASVTNSKCTLIVASANNSISYAGTSGYGVYLWRATAVTGAQSTTTPWPAIATTAVTRTVLAPAVDADDPTAYLVSEQEAEMAMLEIGVARWNRDYANVPATTITFSSQAITKPNPSAYGLNLYCSDATNGGASLSGCYYYQNAIFVSNTVYTVSSSSVTGSLTKPTGGTFTLTYKASTTAALNYNDTGATIAAAVNGLASIIADGVTVTATNQLGSWPAVSGYVWVQCSVGNTTQAITMDASSITPSGANKAFTAYDSSVNHEIFIGARFTKTSHGYDASKTLCLTDNSIGGAAVLVPATTGWSVIDANTIAWNWGITYTYKNYNASFYSGVFFRSYTPGTDRVGVKLSQSFYLPGVTPGITTAADIPIPDPLLNDAAFFTAVTLYLTGYQTYDSTALQRWNGTPIYTQTAIQINMADV